MFSKYGFIFVFSVIAIIAVTVISYNLIVSGGGSVSLSGKTVNAADLESQTPELAPKTMGNPDASVVLHEFSSLSCGHCGRFHTETLPMLKEEYIDTGKILYVYHEFPLDGVALNAATLARCSENDDLYWRITDMFFKEQRSWLNNNYDEAMKRMVKLAGFSDEKISQCLQNRELKKQIAESMQKYAEKYEINSTPSFVFNDGEEKITGNAPISDFRITIERLLQNN